MYIFTYSFTDRVTLKTCKGIRLFSEEDYDIASQYYEHYSLLGFYKHLCLWHCPKLLFADLVKDSEIIKAFDFDGKGEKDL